jgi:hypothetical protein
MHYSLVFGVFAISLPIASAIDAALLLSRNTVSGGGWAQHATSCAPTFKLCTHGSTCCPGNTDCVESGTGSHCCASGTTCHDLIVAAPQCADDSWSLWNSTTLPSGQGYFCCLPGQIGTNQESCVAAGSNVVPTLNAHLVCLFILTSSN